MSELTYQGQVGVIDSCVPVWLFAKLANQLFDAF
jgi:hypothetical protein